MKRINLPERLKSIWAQVVRGNVAYKEGRKEGRKEERKEGSKEGKKEGRKEGRKNRRKEGRKKGKKEGRKKERKEGRKHVGVNETAKKTDEGTCWSLVTAPSKWSLHKILLCTTFPFSFYFPLSPFWLPINSNSYRISNTICIHSYFCIVWV